MLDFHIGIKRSRSVYNGFFLVREAGGKVEAPAVKLAAFAECGRRISAGVHCDFPHRLADFNLSGV